jgi:replication factor C subunit 1
MISTQETQVVVEKKSKAKTTKKSPAKSAATSKSASKEASPAPAKASKSSAPSSSFATTAPIRETKVVNSGSLLWTEKYKPKAYDELIGNNVHFEKVKVWLREWEGHVEKGFPKKGDGALRAVLFSGPPGIGKTSAAHLIARLEGWEVIEFNASDMRSKKSVELMVRYGSLLLMWIVSWCITAILKSSL